MGKDMTKERDYETVWTAPTEESPPPPAYSSTWGNDSVQDEGKSRSWKARWAGGVRHGWIASYQAAKQMVKPVLSNPRLNIWPFLARIRFTQKQCFAFFLVVLCGIVPFVTVGILTGEYLNEFHVLFYHVFNDKVLSCGDSLYGTPQNATVSGIEKFFVLDYTFGSFTFSQVKTMDVAWDILVGRGIQLLAWWAGYVVFSDSLLRAIERHPASFRIFQRIALEGPSLLSVWTLMKEVWVAKSKRTRALFFYMFLSTCYVLSVPTLLGAMTGYDNTDVAWVSLGDADNIVPVSTLKASWILSGAQNETFDRKICQDLESMWKLETIDSQRRLRCACKFPNGTIHSPDPRDNFYPNDGNCRWDYAGNTETFSYIAYYGDATDHHNCKPTSSNQSVSPRTNPSPGNSTFPITVNGKTYDAAEINGTSGYCYNSIGYDAISLYNKSRCLPDTAHPSYQWGFSTIMSALFIFLQFAWCLTMYILWQDAQWHSSLVKTGYQMTTLRAAFVLARAARRRTGLGERQLVRADTRELERELYGSGKMEGTEVEFGIFGDDAELRGDAGDFVTRRRSLRPKYQPG